MIAQALPVVFIAAAAARTGKLVRCANIADAPDVLFYRAKPEKNGRETNGELDLTIQENGILYPIGIGMSAMPEAIMACKFGILAAHRIGSMEWVRFFAGSTESFFCMKPDSFAAGRPVIRYVTSRYHVAFVSIQLHSGNAKVRYRA